MQSDGGTLAPGQHDELRADLRPLLEPDTGLIGGLMTDFACIGSENRLAAGVLLLTTACVPFAPILALVAPALFFALRGPAHRHALRVLAPQPGAVPADVAFARASLATTLARIRHSVRRWP